MRMGKVYYKILGIAKTATEDEIKRAYRKLTITYHPDKNKAAGAEDRFKEIEEAYEVLSVKKKRDIYDQLGKKGLKSGDGGGLQDPIYGDPRATFAQFFGSDNPVESFFTSKCSKVLVEVEVAEVDSVKTWMWTIPSLISDLVGLELVEHLEWVCLSGRRVSMCTDLEC